MVFFCLLLVELSAAANIIRWWKPVMPDAAWSAIFLLLMISVNLVGVRIYGELEYWFALIKILIVFVFVIIGICVTTGGLGGKVIGFEYWREPGAFVDGAVGTVSVLLAAGFSFQGTEIVGITAGEAKNPTKTVPRAIRNVFWRIIFFYIVTIFLIGLCIPNDYPDLGLNSDDPAVASFTLVFKLAGIEVGAQIINAVILTSASVAFEWFLSITAVSGFVSWWGISFVHIRFRRAYKHQGRNLNDLPYRATGYPFSALFACILCILIILGQGYTAFTPTFSGLKFVMNYIGILPFILTYGIYKPFKRTKIVPLDEVDFDTGRVTRFDIEKDEAEDEVLPWYKKIFHMFT
ncbi:hypothetical protein EC973_006554 [Apophysomyces ossiformis]|uniref:Amino acid permease/ SLC12A domain-containing protein n=1 Tax=Apophysomyces ossiformis TaxID=679940 RepID=A0A8H7BW54_9FUNG|nr:hypothetical protein EC973_006554 [Apophysomyces ossiformis]